MKVSVIIPRRPVEPWIDECMASVNAQTHRGIEIIVIEDREAAGPAATRNRGLALADADYVTFCDADDYMAPDAVERMLAAAGHASLVCGSFRKFGTFEQIVTHPTQTLTREDMAAYVLGNLQNPRSNQMLSGCWAKLYQRNLIEPFPALSTAEDMAFNFVYLQRCQRVRFLSDVLYHNRKRPGSLTTVFDERDRFGLFAVCTALRRVRGYLTGWVIDDALEDALDNAKVYHAMLYMGRICDYYGCTPREAMMKVYPL